MTVSNRKSIVVGAALFIFTLAWAFFLNEMGIIPDQLLTGIGQIGLLTKLLTTSFVGFAFFFSLTFGTIAAYSNKDERNKVYVTTIVSGLLAVIIGAVMFPKFSQWFPLAIFYFGAIPFMIEYSRIKKVELKNFVSLRSNYAASKRGMQIVGIGIFITLALFALPQQDLLYAGFEEALFSGQIISQLDIDEVSVDFLISTQQNILTQITALSSYQALTLKDDADAQAFTQTIEATKNTIGTSEYRDQVSAELKEQQDKLDTDAILSQVKKTIPGFGLIQDYYWMIASVVGSVLFFVMSSILLAPLGGILGTIVEKIIPENGFSTKPKEKITGGASGLTGWNKEGKPAQQSKPAGTGPALFGNAKLTTPIVAKTPTYEHKDSPTTAPAGGWGSALEKEPTAKPIAKPKQKTQDPGKSW
jgi:hypothetical protein